MIFLIPALMACALLRAAPPADRATITAEAVRGYVRHAERTYDATLTAAQAMRAAVQSFCAEPSDAALARARESWTAAREVYGRTEAFRFGNGPIDAKRGGVETFVNSWPVDEAYIDAVEGSVGGGIIGNPAKYPALGRAILRLHNRRGGETNVCTGWHAIEFLLWGQDRSDSGPGARPVTDFVDGKAPFANRRREFLLEITDMLCEDLAKVDAQWHAGGENYRSRFEADPKAALQAIMTGVALLAGFEMSGERMAVAEETHDQEEEQSCFSDTTHLDFRANMRGIADVLRGDGAPGVIAVVATVDQARANAMTAALAAAVSAVDATPAPFDRAIRTAKGSPEHAQITAAIAALEKLGEEISAAAKLMGYSLPSEPHG